MRAHVWNALMAIVFSVLIWCAVGAHLTTSGVVRIDLEILVPKDVIIKYGDEAAPDRLILREVVEITVRGPKEKIDRLNQMGIKGRIVYTRDSIKEPLRQGRITIRPKDFVTVPRDLEVERTDPKELVLTFSQVVQPSVWIEPGEIQGKPARGYRVGKVTLSVDQVQVRGDAAILEKHPGTRDRRYKTEPIDLGEEAKATFKVERAILPPSDGIVPSEKVEVTVEILPDLVEEEVEFTVQVLHTPPKDLRADAIEPLPYRVQPPNQDGWLRKLKLKGPRATLEQLREDLRQARISAAPMQRDLPIAYFLTSDLNPKKVEGPESRTDRGIIRIVGLPDGVEFVDANKRFQLKLAAPPVR